MIRTRPLLSLCASIFLLAGCSSSSDNFSNGTPQLVATPDSVSAMLADAADRASTALETLAAIEYSRAPNASIAPIGDAPPELRRAITVNWVGPTEIIAKTLADRAGYSFFVMGSPPVVPVVVSIDVQNTPVIDVLRDIGLQLGMRGNVRVDGQRRTIEIHYAPNTGVGY